MSFDARTTTSGRRCWRVLGSTVLVMVVVATSCAVQPPGPGQTVPAAMAAPSPVKVDLRYGPEPEHLANVYLPTAGGNRGVIVLVHGGGFVKGARGELFNTGGPVVRQLRRGFALVDVEYRLTKGTANTFPTAVQDVSLAVEWVRRHGPAHGLNPRTVLVAGSSAGGTIATLIGVGSNAVPGKGLPRTPRVDGWVSLAGIYDFATPTGASHFGATWLGAARPTRRALEAASPVTHIDRHDPPGYVAHGDHDTVVPVSQAALMLGAAARAGVITRLFYDLVTTGSGSCRWHFPACGMNAAAFDDWVERVVARRL